MKSLGAVVSVIFVGFAVTASHYANVRDKGQPPTTQVVSHDFGSQVIEYLKKGQYDDAVQVCLHSIQNQPSDEGIYQQIAIVYLTRARKEPDKSEQWAEMAVSYTDKALSLNSKDRDSVGALLFQEARAFEAVGDLSSGKRCAYYEKARKLLEDRASRLQGDQVTLAGRTFPLEPLRRENDRVLAGVKDKVTKAQCK